MISARKPPQPNPDGNRSDDYKSFEALTRALVAVPKAEIQAEAEKCKKTEKVRRSA